jgi:AcrR family transcriptional regulator
VTVPTTTAPTTTDGPLPEGAVRRGRPRNESCSAAILSATIDIVAEVGLAGLTMDAVAVRAGVGKATIYRRWSTKEALMLDAWMSCINTPNIPDTGSLRSDVDELFLGVDHPLNNETLQRVFPQMIAAAKIDPEVHEAYRAFLAERRTPIRTVLERAIARGELAADTDVQLAGDLLIAPLLYRWLVTDGVVDDVVITRIIDTVLAGLVATRS